MDVVHKILDLGAEIDRRDHIGRAAIHYASRGRHVDLVRELIARGCDVGLEDKNTQQPLYSAIEVYLHLSS